jgi:hypothetical protein
MPDDVAAAAAPAPTPSPAPEPAKAATTLGAATPAPAPSPAPAATAADWRAGLEGDQLEFSKRLNTPHDAVKVALDLRKANSGMVRLPGKDAKPEEVATFRKAIGVPETPDAYSFAVEGYEPTDFDKAAYSRLGKVLHKHNATAALSTDVAAEYQAIQQEMIAEQDRVALKAREDADASLRKEMGADYEPGLELAKRAVRTFGDDGLVGLFDTVVNGRKLGDDPAVIKAFMKIGRRMGEGEFIGAVGTDQRQGLEAELQQIMRDNPPGTDRYRQPAIQTRLRQINEQLHGRTPVVGTAGRTA